MKQSKLSRRTFLASAAAASMAGCATARKPAMRKIRYTSPNEKLNVAGIGVGGKGGSDIEGCKSENVVALCDVDWDRAAKSFRDFPNAKRYRDFRVMLEKEEKNIDAVTVSTPDHVHTVAAVMAMKMGKHVYVQKPLTHSVYEARRMAEVAREYGVATQMGNQGHSGEGVRRFCEIIWSGMIGPVREAHAWTNRPIWPQGILEQWPGGVPAPLPEEPIPDDKDIDWDLWLGPAPWRPYNQNYAPFNWRGWWDFGTGALGDMACHILDPMNWALMLGAPSSVECISQEGKNDQTAPSKSVIRYEFPARGTMPPVAVYWHDGGNMPDRERLGIPKDAKLGDGDNGSLFVGDDGIISIGTYGGRPRFVDRREFETPPQLIPRSIGHYREWIQACKGGIPSPGNFDYAGPFTEWVVMGNLALRCEGKLLWDGENMKVTNNPEASKFVRRKYRKGWSL